MTASDPGPSPDPALAPPAWPPRRLHPASPVLDLLSSARQWAIPLAFLMISTGEVLVLGPIAFVVIALAVGWKVLAWRRFTYQVAEGVLEHGAGLGSDSKS